MRGEHAGEIVEHRLNRGSVAQHIDAARPRARARDNGPPGGASCRPGVNRSRRAGRAAAAASLASTLRGVLRKCARLDTWVRARPTTSALCSIEAVEFAGQRRDLGRKLSLQTARLAFANARKRFADAPQRLQTDPHLNEDAANQARAKERERPDQSAVEALHLGFQFRDRARDQKHIGTRFIRLRCGRDRKFETLGQKRTRCASGPSPWPQTRPFAPLRESVTLIMRSNSEREYCA